MHRCKSILIIEDDESIRETLRLTLEMEGYKVFTASNGREGIELLPHIQSPCLILLDLMMPIMNGWEFMDTVSQDAVLATIPVVIVSAFAEKARTIRAQGVIKKPIDLEVLFKTAKKYCG